MFVCGGWIGKIVDIVLVILVRQGINLSLTPPIATSVNILKKIESCKKKAAAENETDSELDDDNLYA